ncbi:MAG: hypothetical protein V1645_03245 [archaeon]
MVDSLENTVMSEPYSGKGRPLSALEKFGCAAAGPFMGMLPPRLQVNGLGYSGASIASTSSRVFNGIWSVYAIGSLVAKAFGVDIDPTTHDLITYVGIPVALDSGIREFLLGVRNYFNSPFDDPTEPWGEPMISIIDSIRHPEFYEDKD